MTDDIKTLLAEIHGRTEMAASWRSDDFGHDCQALLEAESNYLQKAADDLARLIKACEIMAKALEQIESMKAMTRLADCCVDKSCHINSDSNLCSFQTGVHYGNADRAADAKDALTQATAALKGECQ